MVTERQLELAEASSLAVISRLVSAPLLWIQWLSGKNIRLVIGRSRVRFPAGSLWIFFSLSPKLTSPLNCYHNIYYLFKTSDCLASRSSVVQPSIVVTETLQETTDWMGYVDPNEPRYCLCNQVSGNYKSALHGFLSTSSLSLFV